MTNNEKLNKKIIIPPIGGIICTKHTQMSKKLGYVQWHQWADRKTKQGHIQRQCPDCKKYLFKCEM